MQKRQAAGGYPLGQSQEGQLLVSGKQGQHDRPMASGEHQEPQGLEWEPACQVLGQGLLGGQLELVALQELVWLQQGSWEMLWPQQGWLELQWLQQGSSEVLWLQQG